MAPSDYITYLAPVAFTAIVVEVFPGSLANELPVHTIVAACALCATVLIAAHRRLPPIDSRRPADEAYVSVPPDDDDSKEQKSIAAAYSHAQVESFGQRWWKLLALFAAVALSIRVELYRELSHATECTIRSPEAFLPLIVALYDSVSVQQSSIPAPGAPVLSETRLQHYFLHRRWRYLPASIIFSVGCYLSTYLWESFNSTYICPIVGGRAQSIPTLQTASLFIDSFLVISLGEILQMRSKTSKAPSNIPLLVISGILLTTACVWSAVGVIIWSTKPHYHHWLLGEDLVYEMKFTEAVLAQAVLLTLMFIFSLYSIANFGLLSTVFNTVLTSFLIPGLHFMWQTSRPLLAATPIVRTASFLLMYFGWWSFQSSRQYSNRLPQWPLWKSTLLLIFCVSLLSPGFRQPAQYELHPIELLMDKANDQFQSYTHTAGQSRTLQDAVVEYKRRYAMRPPPGFDVWYEFAKNRSTMIVDDYDQIYEDLLPFRAIVPAELRRRTQEPLLNPWHDLAGLTIRNGRASLQENAVPIGTHRWMLEGLANLINVFAEHLPDMDLTFNINDEPRVTVPYNDLQNLKAQALKVNLTGHDHWRPDRSESWLPSMETWQSVFHASPFRNIFTHFGSIGCPDGSPARAQQHLSSKSHVCRSCVQPHSEGHFISNWSLAADVCHQPDLRHLHGFYMTPAAFKASYELMPVFSQSKAHGFNDILYPSAWNYMDKAVYAPSEPSGEHGSDTYQPGFPDPDYKQKKNTLFWRGSTSEGVSSGDHSWRGMTRQRLVHMANNLTNSQHDQVTILLPTTSSDPISDPKSDSNNPTPNQKYTYKTLPGQLLHSTLALQTDISIVDRIARCGGIGLEDCKDQETEFGLVAPTDFQSHWKHRYLFDLDGAGFSGRFLPFLHSKSLPFKTALFREWYDSRLVAWKHFVPQDLRLHGLWSTLAYFAGVDGVVQGRRYKMEEHLKEGEEIALAGREWAGKVLRKEDMEIYFFRLLLEWGRLTDDRRTELGFAI